MDEGKVLELAEKSLSLEQESHTIPDHNNYDVFRSHVSKAILQLFEMSKTGGSEHVCKNGVHLALQMQTIFKVQSRAKLQSPRYAQLLEKYDGGSPKLASVIDVRSPRHLRSESGN